MPLKFEDLNRQGQIVTKTLAQVRDIYGRIYYVAWEDWEDNRYKILVPVRNRRGIRYGDLRPHQRPPGGTMIHRRNVVAASMI
jgi:hypothetical protein